MTFAWAGWGKLNLKCQVPVIFFFFGRQSTKGGERLNIDNFRLQRCRFFVQRAKLQFGPAFASVEDFRIAIKQQRTVKGKKALSSEKLLWLKLENTMPLEQHSSWPAN